MRRRERALVAELRQAHADLAAANRAADGAVAAQRTAERQREEAQTRLVDAKREVARLREITGDRRPPEGGSVVRPGEVEDLRRRLRLSQEARAALEQRLADMQAASEARDRQGATR